MTTPCAAPAESTCVFPARLDELKRIAKFVQQRCALLAVAPDLLFRIELALEELFANTVQHGYAGRGDGQVWITLSADANGVYIDYEDGALPCNPLALDAAALAREHAGDDPETRPLGGLGRLLVTHMCSASRYRYDPARHRNILSLEFWY